VTDFRLYPGPLTMEQSCLQIERWLGRPNIWTPEPSHRHMMFLRKTLAAIGGKSRLTPDAHLAALAMEHGLTLCSADRDFARFPGLKWANPLDGPSPI
jgi:predicted nucleic acid-binding protein